jgi:hypothetical protein
MTPDPTAVGGVLCAKHVEPAAHKTASTIDEKKRVKELIIKNILLDPKKRRRNYRNDA